MFGPRAVEQDVAAGRDGGRGPGPRLDPVGDRRCARPARSSRTPSTSIVADPAPWIPAPIATRNAARSAISGSRAALSITLTPSAVTAAIIRFSVAPTLG